MARVRYKNIIAQYAVSGKIETTNSNAVTFKNIGNDTFKVNNISFAKGASLTIVGNENEIDVTEYSLDVGTSTDCLLLVITKVFVD